MGVQLAITYTLTGPDGTVATFNDSSLGTHVGFLDDIDGLDSAPTRGGGAQPVTEGDGGVPVKNWADPRPIILSGFLQPTTAAADNLKIERLQRACRCRRRDATLSWTEADGILRRVLVRLNTGPRIPAAGRAKKIQIGLISASHLIEKSATDTANVTGTTVAGAGGLALNVNNAGNAEALDLVLEVAPSAPINSFTIYDGLWIDDYLTTQGYVYVQAAVTTPRKIVISRKALTVKDDLGADRYRYLTAATVWPGLMPGANALALVTDTGVSCNFKATWRSAWE